jgi:tetratricopeptide (TPR) repeat protein
MKKISLLVALMFVGASLFAQKSSITDAALKYKKYNPFGSMEENKKALSGAKADIDLAAVNTETANDPYMHRYRGIIYFGLMEISTMEAAMSGAQPDENVIKEYDAKIKESFNAVLNHAKGKEDKKAVLEFVNAKSQFVFETALSMFNAKNYAEATQMFIGAYQISKYINVENEEAKGNTMLSFVRATDTLIKQKKLDEASKLGDLVYTSVPKNIEILISLININLQKNDIVTTEKYLNEATSLDTTNKSLFVVLGTSLMELKQSEKAEQAFLKALKIDQFYADAVYQYCTFMFNWSRDMSNASSDLNPKDPNVAKMQKEALDIMNRIPTYLEPYLEKNPSDKTALEIGWKVYYMLENEEKSAALKKRWEAIK